MLSVQSQPDKLPLYKAGDMVMGFAIHYPVSGKIKGLNYNLVDLEWEYFIENDDGYDGKLRERKIIKFGKELWDEIEKKWDRAVELMTDAGKLKGECMSMLRDEFKRRRNEKRE